MGELRRLLAFVRPYWRRLLVATLFLLITSGLSLVLPWVVQGLIDTVFTSRDLAALNRIVFGLIGVFAVQGIFVYSRDYLLNYVSERVVADLRTRVYEQLMRLSLSFFAVRSVGGIISRVTNDVTVIQTALTVNLVTLFSQMLMLAGGVAIMAALNWRLTLLMGLMVPVALGVAAYFNRRLRAYSMRVQEHLAEATGVLEETVGGVRIVKSFAREAYEVDRFRGKIARTVEAAMARARARAVMVPIIQGSVYAAIGLVLWYGGTQVISGEMTAGSLVAFLLYAIVIAGPVNTLTTLYAQVQEALGAARRVLDLLDATPDVVDVPDAVALPAIEGHVRFDDVEFSYEAGDPVLRNVNLEVAPGQVVALVGRSGAGKTTLVNLIARFYDPVSGRIEIDGHDLRQVTLESLRRQIGIVPQETVLFSGTVRENLAYGKLDATDEEIIAAAKAANAHQFITQLAGGYDAVVGDRGAKLSGGERQRLAIARAILKNPRILILDEATSSLDTESERLVQEALERLMAGRTTFVIAHRLSTVHNADQIAVIEDGSLVEIGTHAELMAQSGLYAHLYSLQFASPKDRRQDERAEGQARLEDLKAHGPFFLLPEWAAPPKKRPADAR